MRKAFPEPERLSFPNASIGNPDETATRPTMKTFGGDNPGINSNKFFDARKFTAWHASQELFHSLPSETNLPGRKGLLRLTKSNRSGSGENLWTRSA
jgi:hypothetical protein